jgi:leucine dehydrogenase
MKEYDSFDDALQDVLNLSEGMTFKNSLAGLNIGGGKSVIIANSKMTEGREDLFKAFGKCVDTFEGKYYTAEDMGTSVEDIETVLKTTKFAVGGDRSHGGAGDPSPYTAKGVFDGMRACLEHVYGSGSYSGKRVAIQGIGHVGHYLGSLLREAGAELIITDTDKDRLSAAAADLDAEVVGLEEIYSVDCDVFAPCAIGGTLNNDTVEQLRCKVIAGAANNQQADNTIGRTLVERGITYAPDFALNSGGVILCADELEEGGFNSARVDERVAQVYHTVGSIIAKAKETGELPGVMAVRMARERIEQARK